jgi:opacity protein-like surface antigen
MRTVVAVFLCVVCVLVSAPAFAQDRFRVAVNAGRQSTSTTVSEEQTFQQYFEQGSFTFERTIPKDVFYDVWLSVRVWRGLSAGVAVSIFDNTGAGQIEARVPHPLIFDRPRTTTAGLADVTRREVGQHITIGWIIPATERIDFTVFGGPSIFTTEETFVTGLMMSLNKEVFPFDQLAFPGAQTETQRENVTGYNAGVDMSWRFTDHIGVGALLRYASGKKDFTPTGGTPVEVEVGGLHAGGGVRLAF